MTPKTTLPILAVSCAMMLPTAAPAFSIQDYRKTDTVVMPVSDRATPQSLREAWDMFRSDVRQAGEEIMSISDSWSTSDGSGWDDRDEDDDYDDDYDDNYDDDEEDDYDDSYDDRDDDGDDDRDDDRDDDGYDD